MGLMRSAGLDGRYRWVKVIHRRVSALVRPCLLAVLLACLIIGQSNPLDSATGDGYELLNTICHARLNPAEQAAVHNLTLTHNDIEFHFENGAIFRSMPIEGRITGFYFSGKGWATFTPGDPAAECRLNRLTGSRSGFERCTFDRFYCRFADWNDLSFGAAPAFLPVTQPQNLDELSRQMERWLTASLARHQGGAALSLNHPYLEIFRDFSLGRRPGSFYAVYRTRDAHHGADRMYRYEPADFEEIAYNGWCRYSTRTTKDFHPEFAESPIDALWYNIGADIDSSGQIDLFVEGRFIVLTSNVNHIFLNLAPIFDIDQVTDERDQKLAFVAGEGEDDLQGICVFFLHTPSVGDTIGLHFKYRGAPAVATGDGGYYIPHNVTWYPTTPGRDRAIFDVSFDFPSSFSLVASGRKVGEEETAEGKKSYWVQSVKSWDFTFGFGTYLNNDYFYEGLPPVTIMGPYSSPEDSPEDRQRKFAGEVLSTLAYFQKIYGPYPFENLAVMEIPCEEGAAFSGLIHIPGQTLKANEKGVYDASLGHQLAHQWWGYVLRKESYHDFWVVAGVTGYSAALYVENSRKREDLYHGLVRSWKNEILAAENREVEVSLSDGFGLSEKCAQAKAAYVIHMLCMMMRDLDIGSDWRFTAMLRDFLEFYRGEEVTSQDFENQAELYYGAPLDWFFDQWVRGTAIPTYASRYEIERRADGKYAVSLEVEQTGVAEEFKMPVPVSVTFPYRRPYRTRVWVSGHGTTIELGPFEYRPDQVIFNDFNAVLARTGSPANRIAESDPSH